MTLITARMGTVVQLCVHVSRVSETDYTGLWDQPFIDYQHPYT